MRIEYGSMAIALAICVVVPGITPGHLAAATIPVTSTADAGAGSLRDALNRAANGDTIDASGVSGTITLTTGGLQVWKSVAINGPGPDALSVNGNAAGSVFRVSVSLGTSISVTISGLTITNGNAARGGGIEAYNTTLTVSNCTIVGNSASSAGGGVYNERSTLTVSDCTIVGNLATGEGSGGGIYNNGGSIFNSGGQGAATVTVANCTLSGNSASYGGGICNDARAGGSATLEIANSTFSGNSASYGGGILTVVSFGGSSTVQIANSTFSGNSAVHAIGGGIANDGSHAGSATMQIVNSTFSGNSAVRDAGGGIWNFANDGIAPLTIASCTFSGNSARFGGGILNSGGSATLRIGNTILNAGASGENLLNRSGTVTSDGYNLSSDDGGGLLTATGDQIGIGPQLGSLQDNGGPTFTHNLSCASPAIDAGDPTFTTPPDFDQRGPGFERVVGGRIDTGAVEVGLSQTFTVANTRDSGPGSLRQAVLDANAAPGADTIEFLPSADGTIVLTHGELLIANCLVLNGPGRTNLVVDGNRASGVFHIRPGIVVSISGLTIANGSNGQGGGIFNGSATLTISNCSISGNSASSMGGGILNYSYAGSAVLEIVSCSISGNSGVLGGGGIYNVAGTGNAVLEIIDSTISDNTSISISSNSWYDFAGGSGILNNGRGGRAALVVIGSTVSNNVAVHVNSGTRGGGVYNNGAGGSATAEILNCTFSGNSATYGNSIYNDGIDGIATLRVWGTILHAGVPGGNIQDRFGTVTSEGYNLSNDDGGGFLSGPGDRIHTVPGIGPLMDNGGPTFTHALLPGSPAIDAGDPGFAAAGDFDQRGPSFPRLVGDRIDIGAVEFIQSMEILKQQAKLSFAKPNADSFGLTASLDPGASFSPAGQVLHLDVGGAVIDVALDGKGRGRTAQGRVALALDKKTGKWTLKATFKKGSWQAAWAGYGLVNATVPRPGLAVILPTFLTMGDSIFRGERSLAYTAKAGKSGSAR